MTSLGIALEALAQASGYTLPAVDIPPLPSRLVGPDVPALDQWLGLVAAQLHLETEPIYANYTSVTALVRGGGPALLRLPGLNALAEERLLLLLPGSSQHAIILDPTHTRHRLPVTSLSAALVAPHEAPLLAEVAAMLAAAGVPPRRRNRARTVILRERLSTTEVVQGWLLRLPPGARLKHLVGVARLPMLLIALVGVHAVQYLLWLLAWWTVGRGILQGQLDPGWFLAWGLLLLTLIPLRLLSTWLQGVLTMKGGELLKQRLLAGCLRLAPETIRHQGVGQLLGRVIETEEIETLALNGGLYSLVAGVELLFAVIILSRWSVGVWHGLLLLAWVIGALLLTAVYTRQRQDWTAARLAITHDLIERMVGQRTRLAQEPAADRHAGEDRALRRYLGIARCQDPLEALLLAAFPRGWLLVGVLALAPVFIANRSSPAALAVGIGATLLAYLSLQGFVQGLWNIAGAVVAWQQIAELVQAAARPEDQGAGGSMLNRVVAPAPAAAGGTLVTAANLVFRYRVQGEPVLRGCQMQINRGDRLLLEGPSGGGKSTLAALLTGLRLPESGLLLLHGLDRQSLGAAGWRRQVVAAPQFHENHVLTETFAFNLLMGRRWPPFPQDLAQAEALCRELGLGDLLDRMPGGMFQMVGETGWQLSHGEKSRLYIARALLQGADLVILDESFAALDPENLARALRCALDHAPTLLVIAHP